MRKHYLILIIAFCALAIVFNTYFAINPLIRKNIVIGVLVSETGIFSDTSIAQLNSIKLAAETINNEGGINGKKVILAIESPGSDYSRIYDSTLKLIEQDKAQIIIGCWTSACRKAIKPVIEKYNILLLYPNPYEGLEYSENIIYLGSTPNQIAVPATNWMMKNFGSKAYLVGSDGIYCHVTNFIARTLINVLGGEVIGESYIPLMEKNSDSVISDIKAKNPDFVLNSLEGEVNIDFYNKLYSPILPYKGNTMSLNLSKNQILRINPTAYDKMYSAWAYFPSQINAQNKLYIKNYISHFGSTDDVNDPAATAYAAMYLLKQAIERVGSVDPMMVRLTLMSSSVSGPMGPLYIDGLSGNAWREAFIAKIDPKGHEIIVWKSVYPIEPLPYPKFKSQADWDLFEYQLYIQWNHNWENQSP